MKQITTPKTAKTIDGYIFTEEAELRLRTGAEALATLSNLCMATRTSTDTEVQTHHLAPILQSLSWAMGDLLKEVPYVQDVYLKN